MARNLQNTERFERCYLTLFKKFIYDLVAAIMSLDLKPWGLLALLYLKINTAFPTGFVA